MALIQAICRPSAYCDKSSELGVLFDENDYCCPRKWEYGNITNGVCVSEPNGWVACTAGTTTSTCDACGDDAACHYYPKFNSTMCEFHKM